MGGLEIGYHSLDREDWEDCVEDSSTLVISSRDKLIQTKFLHRVYYTPQSLYRKKKNCSAVFNWCGTLYDYSRSNWNPYGSTTLSCLIGLKCISGLAGVTLVHILANNRAFLKRENWLKCIREKTKQKRQVRDYFKY